MEYRYCESIMGWYGCCLMCVKCGMLVCFGLCMYDGVVVVVCYCVVGVFFFLFVVFLLFCFFFFFVFVFFF